MGDTKSGSSSEDEYDVYLNSVALLKALKKEVPPITNDNLEKTNDNKEETKTTNVRRKGRRTRQRAKNCQSAPYVSDDLEIVSVQENLNGKDNLCTNTRQEVNDLIVLDNDEDAENEDVDKNYDVNVKILWQSRTIHRLNIHNHENFRKIFQHFADMENVSIERIMITKKDKCVNITDTPSSIGLSVIDILEGGIMDADAITQNKNQRNIIDENVCQIKVQTANKESLVVPLKKNQQFKILIASCAREWNVNESSIKLYFDGEPINVNDTPENLDFEQEACVDLRISAK